MGINVSTAIQAPTVHACPRCGGPSINHLDVDDTDLCGRCFMGLVKSLDSETGYALTKHEGWAARLEDGELYTACRTNEVRATKPQMAALHEILIRITTDIAPCTVRQVFYQATVRGAIDKTEAGYDRVQRALVQLRRTGRIPFRKITDNTRWQIKPTTYDGPKDALEDAAREYRRAVWGDVDAYVEIWIEKDALAGVVAPITGVADVALMVSRGYSSLTFLHSSAEDIADCGKPAYIYQLGDFDPSGQDAARHIEQTLRELAPRAEIHFERLAVLPQQIEEWRLPSRPTKTTDSRAKGFGYAESVELDSIHPDNLRGIVAGAISRHLPANHIKAIKAAEDSDRERLRLLAFRNYPS